MIGHDFPYLDTRDLNLDWLIKNMKQILIDWAEYQQTMNQSFADLETANAAFTRDMTTAFNTLHDYVEDYFDNLNVQTEINNKLDAMRRSGELAEVMNPLIATQTSAWLAEHITNPSNPPIDTSLTVAGAAADAKVTGTEISALNTNTGATTISGWVDGKAVRNDGVSIGNIANMSNRRYTIVACSPGDVFTVNAVGLSAYRAWAFTDDNDNIISKSKPEVNLTNAVIIAPAGATKLYINAAMSNSASFKNKTAVVQFAEIKSDLADIYPQIVRINDLMTNRGGILSSSHVSNNIDTYRHTAPIFITSGTTIYFNLYALNTYTVLSAYSSTTISAETYIDGVNGVQTGVGRIGKWTAQQDCYVILTTNVNYFDNTYAFVYNDMIDSVKASHYSINNILDYIKNPDNQITNIITGKTINASGVIANNVNCAITNTIAITKDQHLMVQAFENSTDKWLSVNFYSDSDAYLGRLEFRTQFNNDGGLEIPLIVPFDSSYAIIAMNYTASDKVKATYSLVPSAYDELEESDAKIYTNNFILSANHRGYNPLFPENTTLAFAESKRKGFDFIENDVRWTSDGVAVLLHDETINRVARNADGTEIAETINIADITYAQALTYDFGIYKGPEFAGTRICTLEQCIAFCRNAGIKILLEPKLTGHAAEIVNMVKKYDMLNNVIFNAFNTFILTQIAEIVPEADYMLTRSAYSAEGLAECVGLKDSSNKVYFAVDYRAETLNQDAVNAMISAGIKLAVYIVDSESAIIDLNPYVSMVTSDNLVAGIVLANNVLI